MRGNVLTDIDECRSPTNNCRHACKNLVGSFMCICPEGFEQIGLGDVCKGTRCFTHHLYTCFIPLFLFMLNFKTI